AWAFVTRRSGATTVVFTDALLLPAPVRAGSVGSVTPAGVTTLAVFVNVPDCGAVAVIVKVTVAPEGSVAIVLVTALPARLTAPHAAPPVGLPQLAVIADRTAGTLSLDCAALAAWGPALDTTPLYVTVPPFTTFAGPD